MTNMSDEQIVEVLRKALLPMADAELKRDLWPAMLRRLDQRPVRVPWFDWALLAMVPVAFVLFPELIPGLLYHL